MAAGSIIIDLLMRTGSFETDTKRAQRALRELEKTAVQVGKTVGAAFTAAVVASAYFVKAQIDAADAASKQAQALGVSIEAYTALGYAASLSGVSQEDMGAAMSKLTKRASDAASGVKDAAAAFKTIGVSVTDASGDLKSMDNLLGDLADRFASFRDGPEKTALAIELFGKAGAKLVPFLNLGRDGIEQLRDEAVKLGVVLDSQTGKAAEQFNDNLERLEVRVRGLGYRIAKELLPGLNDLLEVFLNRGLLEAVSRFGEIAFPNFVRQEQLGSLAILNQQLADIESKRKSINADSIKGGVLQLFGISGESLDRDEAKIRGQIKAIEDAIKRVDDAKRFAAQKPLEDRGFDPRAAAPKLPSVAAGGGSAVDKAERYLENLRKQLESTQNLTVAERLLADIRAGALGTVTATQEKQLMGIAKEIDATREAQRVAQERAAARKKEDDEIAASIRANEEADRQRLKSLTAGTDSEQLKAVTSDIRFLNEAYAAGKIEVGLWAEAVVQATGRLNSAGEEIDSFTKTMQENVQSFLGSAFADAMEGNFKSIGKAFTQMINRMVAEALAADLARRIFGSAAKGGEGGGWLGAAIGWLGTAFGGAKAGGGDVMPGRSYWVGEQGPERFVPRTMGKILPAGASAGGRPASTMVVHNTFSIAGPVDRRTEQQIAAAAGRGLQRAAARIG